MAGKIFLEALHGRPTPRTPIWMMRQAGRYLPEYRAVRAEAQGFLDLCYTPDLAVEVTLQPIRRYGFDAAILFSDILVVPDALGAEVAFVEGEGPRLTPLKSEADVNRLSADRLHDHLEPAYESLRRLRCELPAEVALIGFAGAPWTLAAYMIEGGGSKEFALAREMARREPLLFGRLIDLLTSAVIDYCRAQVEAGAEALQLFDSWAGVLAPDERDRWCQEPARRIVAALEGTPVIAFPRGIGAAYAPFVAAVRPAGLSLDTTVDPVWAAGAIEDGVCLQGNLDPIALIAGGEGLDAGVRRIEAAWRGRAHVFNLGHGVLPHTPVENVARLVGLLKNRAD